MLSSSLPRGLSPSTRLRGVEGNTTMTSRCGFSVSGSRATRPFASNKNQRAKKVTTMANSSSPFVNEVDVAIVGGGPAGLSAALAIERAAPGTRVAVFERARSLKPVGFTIGLMGNGIAALEALDPDLGASVFARLLPDAPMQNFDPDTGELRIEAASTCGIFRKWNDRLGHFPWHELVDELAARLRPGVLRLGHCFEAIEQDEGGVRVTCLDAATGERATVSASVAVGCDGNQSAVRAALLGDGAPHYAGLGVWRGQCDKPGDWDAKYGKNLLTGWARSAQLMLVVKLRDGKRLAWQCMGPWPEERLGELASTRYTDAEATRLADEAKRARCLSVYGDNYPEIAVGLIRSTRADTITEHGQYFREADECGRWGSGEGAGRITLCGDSAHLMTPFLGQGTNQALEDALELGRAVGRHGATREALKAYEAVRIPAATRVQRGSVAIAKSMASGGKISEIAWYDEHPDVLCKEFEPLVASAAAAGAGARS